jgi:hypothetical protein
MLNYAHAMKTNYTVEVEFHTLKLSATQEVSGQLEALYILLCVTTGQLSPTNY